ncbi:MAG: hypothetical protein QGH99_06990 [Pseudomonadales bacterium]|jgi:hypothetical protein|nr:hypothetical protein [Pseudomonadales bacterium]MDP6316989.1 hypothetical protein [Pseudomonadales bacterium]MDP7313912.1 hypothetical protein [Pseudomonadales bacterium]MDP7576694.1 hypothetical protein [Pseudomonadales bacterium]HJP49640.1 hypothetical protein [Pseudomonadales bacterium]|tara:strand:- start:11 stop:133 length:123 start_codon:yes stop_codon:yes gene_type:complete
MARHLGGNPTPLRKLRLEADIVVSGESELEQQLKTVRKLV